MCIEEKIMTIINYLDKYKFLGAILYASTRNSSDIWGFDFLIEHPQFKSISYGLRNNYPELSKETEIHYIPENGMHNMNEFSKREGYIIIYKN